MLYGIIGKKGSGKTLLLVYLIVEYLKLNKKLNVFTSFTLNRMKYNRIDFKKIFEIKMQNAIVGLDEAYLFADCRMSPTKFNRLISYLIYQTRKAKLDVYFTSPSFNDVDVRLRRICDGLLFPEIWIDNKKVQNPEAITIDRMKEFVKEKRKIQIKGMFITDTKSYSFCVDDPQNILNITAVMRSLNQKYKK